MKAVFIQAGICFCTSPELLYGADPPPDRLVPFLSITCSSTNRTPYHANIKTSAGGTCHAVSTTGTVRPDKRSPHPAKKLDT